MFATRFAPSPNGDLHLGHALSALTGYGLARRSGGRFLVRIEDIDISRTREEYVAQIFEDLTWLGLSWEEPVLRQSRQFAEYQRAAARLRHMGLLYPCPATRGEINSAVAALEAAGGAWPSDPDGAPIYPGVARRLVARWRPNALREASRSPGGSTWQRRWR
ncbi:MAG: glutamate--tRNA ligase family protein [Hyphomicrobiaceae bacterium]